MADFSSEFSSEFSSPGHGSGLDPGSFQGLAGITSSSILDANQNRLTKQFVYINFHRAIKDLDLILGAFNSSNSIPITLLNGKHDSGSTLTVCFAGLAADINRILDLIRQNNL